jgi:archaellum component FlaC
MAQRKRLKKPDLVELIVSLRDEMISRFDSTDKKFGDRFDGVDKRFDGIDLRLDGMDRRFDGIDLRLAGHDEKFKSHDKRFDDHDKRFDDHDKRFDSLENEVKGLRRMTESNMKDIFSLHEKVMGSLDGIKLTLYKLAGMDSHEERITTLEREMSVVKTALSEKPQQV